MIEFKTIKPFLQQFIKLVLVISLYFLVFALLIKFNCVELYHGKTALKIAIIIYFIIIFFGQFYEIFSVAIRAFLDFVFQRTKQDTYVFSAVSAPFATELRITKDISYLVEFEKDGEKYSFILPKYVEFEEQKEYDVVIASRSQIILMVIDSKTKEQKL